MRRSADAEWFQPVLLVEAMAQLAGIAAGQREGEGGILAAIERAEIPCEVKPGDPVEIRARVIKGFGRLFLVDGEAWSDGRIIARATLTLAIGSLQ